MHPEPVCFSPPLLLLATLGPDTSKLGSLLQLFIAPSSSWVSTHHLGSYFKNVNQLVSPPYLKPLVILHHTENDVYVTWPARPHTVCLHQRAHLPHHSLCCRPVGPPLCLRKPPAWFFLRAFVPAVPPAWNTLPGSLLLSWLLVICVCPKMTAA